MGSTRYISGTKKLSEDRFMITFRSPDGTVWKRLKRVPNDFQYNAEERRAYMRMSCAQAVAMFMRRTGKDLAEAWEIFKKERGEVKTYAR